MAQVIRYRETEKGFTAAVTNLAKHLGWRVFHPFWSVRSTPGFPDLTLVKPPRIIYAELKTESGRLTPSQEAWIHALQQCHGICVFVWRPSNWDAIVRVLKEETSALP